ncbi:MAG TPA: dihydrolipoamide acetyltransferase family protein, partial [Gemmatimonadales bacterium]|nr:dihydrolipoamide acetyltransferase family protein [Gemmatimonadales bacterium]
MPTKVVMEALSPTMEEGRLVEWKKQEGDTVAVGDVLAEVETDKAVMELVARASGTLLKHIVEAGATVPVSEPVAVIGEPGEEIGREAGQQPGARAGAGRADGRNQPTSMPPAPPAPAAAEATRPAPTAAVSRSAPGVAGRVKASPLARRIAAERGVDLAALAGSGPEGRIVARDLERPAAPAMQPPVTAAARPLTRGPLAPSEAGTAAPPYTDVPLTQIRKAIAKRLTQSIGPIPTFYLTTEVDMERVAESRAALLAGQRGSGADAQESKVSVNDIVIKAVASALRQHPECNAWWQDDHIRYWNEIHVSMAV